MSDASSGDAAEELFEERVAPVLFAGRSAESTPVLTIIVGQPGAAPLPSPCLKINKKNGNSLVIFKEV